MNTIGERIKYLRKRQKLTQYELSEKTNISRGNLSNYEKDRFKPASDSIIALANFFNVSTDWLLTGKSNDTFDNSLIWAEELQALTDEDKKDMRVFIEFLKFRKK